jgi:hypothetical protein
MTTRQNSFSILPNVHTLVVPMLPRAFKKYTIRRITSQVDSWCAFVTKEPTKTVSNMPWALFSIVENR